MITLSKRKTGSKRATVVEPFCDCSENKKSIGHKITLAGSFDCKCGENIDIKEWRWEVPTDMEQSWLQMADDQREVLFHPYYSSGTAVVKGSTPFSHDHLYYWEVKMLSEPYGTDIMIGLGTDKVDVLSSRYRFTSLLGQSVESYGLSYKGVLHHDGVVARQELVGFCKGSIVGVKVDLWQGTLEFFLNRQSRGVSFFNLRRHPSMSLYPMMCSTAAQSSIRLIYAGSWQASLLADAAKILGASLTESLAMPPGLKNKMNTLFWLMLSDESRVTEELEEDTKSEDSSDIVDVTDDMQFGNVYRGYFHDDSVDKDHRIALIYDDL